MQGLWNLLGCLLNDFLHPSFQVGTLFVHLLHDLESLKNGRKVRLLLQGLLSHLKDNRNLFLVLRDALHLLELLIELLQLAAELLGIIVVVQRGLGDTVIAKTPLGHGILGFELGALVICVVVGVVEVLDLVEWVLLAHKLLKLIQLALHAHVPLVCFRKQVRFELLDLVGRVVDLHDELNVRTDLLRVVLIWAFLGRTGGKELLDSLLQFLFVPASFRGEILKSGLLGVRL